MITDPMLDEEPVVEERTGYDPKRYADAVTQGLSGTDLARAAGIAVPRGFSPPQVSPAPDVQPPSDLGFSSANRVVYTPEDEFLRDMKNTVANMPIKQAQDAINSAQQFHAMRIFQNKVSSGADPAVAAMEIAPLLNKGTAAALLQMNKQRIGTPPRQISVPGEGIFERDPVTGKTSKVVEFAPKSKSEKTISVPGVGVFERDEAGKFNKVIDAAEKQPKFSPRKLVIDPETGATTALTGDPLDPEYMKEVEAIKKREADRQAEPNALQKLWDKVVGGKSESVKPITAPESVSEAPIPDLEMKAEAAGVPLILTKEEFGKFKGGRYMNKSGKIARKE